MDRIYKANELHFQLGRTQEASDLILRYHYSGRVPESLVCVGTFHIGGGLFGDSGECVAACCFGIPPTRWSQPVVELQRLVRAEGIGVPLSRLVALTCNAIRHKSLADLLVSFADAGEDHHGGIYQACSWNYNGRRESRMDGLIVAGQFVPGRSANSTWGTRSPRRLAERGIAAEPHFDIGKHLYWRAMTRRGDRYARSLGLACVGYPKPNGIEIQPVLATPA